MLRASVQAPLARLDLRVAVAVPSGRCLALAGPSGAGKTTVLRLVAGLFRPAHGRVTCADEVWLDTDRRIATPPERRRCGYLFQEYALFPHLRAWQNVAYGMREVPRRARRRRAEALLERFGVGALADARPRELSGGERQRVALARALGPAPRALLLDEPLAALDARSRAGAARELAAFLREADVPVLVVTHDFAEAALLGDRIAVLDGGRVRQEGTAAELAARPASGFVADFAGATVLRGFAGAGADGLTVVELEGGGSVSSTARAHGPVAVSVYPWEIELEPPGAPHAGSARNRIAAEVVSVTRLGSRVRVGLSTPQPLSAELTDASARRLGLEPGRLVVATWKAAATRLSAF